MTGQVIFYPRLMGGLQWRSDTHSHTSTHSQTCFIERNGPHQAYTSDSILYIPLTWNIRYHLNWRKRPVELQVFLTLRTFWYLIFISATCNWLRMWCCSLSSPPPTPSLTIDSFVHFAKFFGKKIHWFLLIQQHSLILLIKKFLSEINIKTYSF